MHERPLNTTKRPVEPGAERMIDHVIPLYPTEKHPEGIGSVTLLDYMGSEAAIATAARQSYGEGTKAYRSDAGLLRYLVAHKHTGPLEFAEISVNIKAPISVARQIVRHRTANWSELSGRYSILPTDTYVPPMTRMQAQSTDNKQGSGDLLDEATAIEAQAVLEQASVDAIAAYMRLLDLGLAREVARTAVPLGVMTQWTWKMDIHNLLKFLWLRLAPDAQDEARQLANGLAEIVRAFCPHIFEAAEDYWWGAVAFAKHELPLLGRVLHGTWEPVLELPWWEADKETGISLHGFDAHLLLRTARKCDMTVREMKSFSARVARAFSALHGDTGSATPPLALPPGV